MGVNKKEIERQKMMRQGLCFITKYGESFVITKYESSKKIKIKFQNGYEKDTEWNLIIKYNLSTPYSKTVCNVGYLGKGKYKVSENGKKTKAYEYWHHMLKRCYDPYELNKRPTYIDCYVCEEWHNFQNFAKWFYKNYYEVEGQRMHLDKDILCKGNKIYSPETCVFVPQRINALFVKCDKIRGKYPIGVSVYYDKRCLSECLIAYCRLNNKRKSLGYFPLNRPFQAFTCYKQFKENYIKQVADEYKDLIPKKLYEALYRYEVEIND